MVFSRYLATQKQPFTPELVQKQTRGLLSPAEMFKTEKLRAVVNERLQAAAEEIFNLFEEAVRDYEKEVLCSKQEVEQQRRSLTGWKGNGRTTLKLHGHFVASVKLSQCSVLGNI